MEDNLESTKLRDIDEELRQRLIIDLLERADVYLIKRDYELAYLTLKNLFYKIRPFKFKYKEELEQLNELIDNYLDNLGDKPMDMQQHMELSNKRMKVKEIVDMFSKFIPLALNELGLYFRISNKEYDDDEHFFNKTFDMDKSSITEKKEYLSQFDSKTILHFITSRQINDVYARIKINNVLRTTRPDHK